MPRVAMVWGLWLRCWFLLLIIDVVAVDDVVARVIVSIFVVDPSFVVRFLIVTISWGWLEVFWPSIFLIIFIWHVFLSLFIIILSFVAVKWYWGPGSGCDSGSSERAALRFESCEGVPKRFSHLGYTRYFPRFLSCTRWILRIQTIFR